MPIIHGGQSVSEYVYQEYPKWITLPDGTKKIVEDAHEEHQALGTTPKEEDSEPPFVGFMDRNPFISQNIPEGPVITGFDSKKIPSISDGSDGYKEDAQQTIVSLTGDITIDDVEVLRVQADDLGLIYDKRWGAVKLRQAIDNARKNATNQ